MIDDLLTELTLGLVDRLLSPQTPREEAAFGLARLAARLAALRGEQRKPESKASSTLEVESEGRLLHQYLQLTVDDLQQIPPNVHEWVLERFSNGPAASREGISETLTTLYFLFPDSTVRHAVIGLLLQADGHQPNHDRLSPKPPITTISDAIGADKGVSNQSRVEQIRVLVDYLLDYLDLFPDPTERALSAIHQAHGDDSTTAYLLSWSRRFGGEPESRVRRALERSDRHE